MGYQLTRRAAAACAMALGLSAPAPASAGHSIFHVFTPAIEAGAWGVEALSAFNTGLPSAGEHTPLQAAHELAIHTGVNEYWMAKLALGIEKPAGDSYQLNSIALENVFRVSSPPHGPFDAAWFTALSAGIDADATHAVEFGPVLTFDSGPFALVINPFLEKTFGDNREPGIALTYGWRATYRISDLFSIGAEGYGAVEDLGNTPPARDQIHRVGPVLYLGHVHGATNGIHGAGHAGHGEGHRYAKEHGHASAPGHLPEWHGEIGVLFGLTNATDDAAIKFNFGADF
ncbi:MAG: hypothetical protein ABL893_00800 [Hyphomicrobium sp.]|nr:hypothetical protein [Hyphomicrobium sp.]